VMAPRTWDGPAPAGAERLRLVWPLGARFDNLRLALSESPKNA
jgi:hypothetical protein